MIRRIIANKYGNNSYESNNPNNPVPGLGDNVTSDIEEYDFTETEEERPKGMDEALENFERNGIPCSEEDIESINMRYDRPVDSQSEKLLEVKMKNGEVYRYTRNGDLYSATLADGTQISMSPPLFYDYERGALKHEADLNAEIKGYATVNANGETTRVYWLDDEATDFTTFKEEVGYVKEAMESTPENVLDECMDGDFFGFVVGATSSEDNFSSADDHYNAYAHGDNFIYISSEGKATERTIIHELSHIYDYDLGGNNHFSENNSYINDFYDEYNEAIKPLIPEHSGYHTTGPTDVQEFFACAYEAYVSVPDELRETLPEVYDYMDRLTANT